jgi:DNA-binding PadR family transcriptional regulator
VRPAVLAVLAAGSLHGYRILGRIAALPPFGGTRPDPSGLYRTLRAMEREGLVAATWKVSERGPAKRLYTMTAAGRECLARWTETLEAYRRTIAGLLATARRALRPGRRGA